MFTRSALLFPLMDQVNKRFAVLQVQVVAPEAVRVVHAGEPSCCPCWWDRSTRHTRTPDCAPHLSVSPASQFDVGTAVEIERAADLARRPMRLALDRPTGCVPTHRGPAPAVLIEGVVGDQTAATTARSVQHSPRPSSSQRRARRRFRSRGSLRAFSRPAILLAQSISCASCSGVGTFMTGRRCPSARPARLREHCGRRRRSGNSPSA